ncbi:hypothetical protein H3H36_17915 [Duganella sp. FT3S]|uniref:Uncharacterized protein n=1 Tax=Rugamonas fusca TaxID=2758568 RepID=A0A7W2EJT2_9BURK|nr:hypothetical protein [Rugamonas fusca]MBA5607237.1 hypothetical protein [Rugamonas fusca]
MESARVAGTPLYCAATGKPRGRVAKHLPPHAMPGAGPAGATHKCIGSIFQGNDIFMATLLKKKMAPISAAVLRQNPVSAHPKDVVEAKILHFWILVPLCMMAKWLTNTIYLRD